MTAELDQQREFPLPDGVERIAITSREQWLELRKPDLTASTIGALFGVHDYETIAGLHAAKCGLELPGPDPESAVIRRGNALEQVVANEVARQHPEWTLVKANEYLRDPKLRLGATPDFYILGDPRGLGVLQAKTVGQGKFKREWGDEGSTPPFWIALQNATEVMLRGAAFGVIGALVIGDFTFETYPIELPRHAAAERRIADAVKLFWSNLEAGVVPVIDYERDGALIELMYPRHVPGKSVDLSGDNRAAFLCEERERLSGVIKAAESARAAAEVELRSKIGDSEIAIVRGWKVSLRLQHRKEFVSKATSFRTLRTSREVAA